MLRRDRRTAVVGAHPVECGGQLGQGTTRHGLDARDGMVLRYQRVRRSIFAARTALPRTV